MAATHDQRPAIPCKGSRIEKNEIDPTADSRPEVANRLNSADRILAVQTWMLPVLRIPLSIQAAAARFTDLLPRNGSYRARIVGFVALVLLLTVPLHLKAQALCYEDGGTKVCSEYLTAWTYGQCDNYAASLADDAMWCRAHGGQWVNANVGCVGGDAVRDSNIVSSSQNWYRERYSCPVRSTTDSGWGQTISSWGCWSGSPAYYRGKLVQDYRVVTLTGPTRPDLGCSGPEATETVFAIRWREVKCPAGFKDLSDSAGNAIGCYNETDNTCPINNPVRPAGGGQLRVETDFSGQGQLALQRSYAPQANYSPLGMSAPEVPSFGESWTYNYGARLYLVANSSFVQAIATRPDGTILYFDANGRPLQHLAGAQWTLASDPPNGQWTLSNGLDKEVYDASGRLIRLEHAGGTWEQLTYDPDARTIRISDQSGRALTLYYRPSLLIGAAELPDGRRLTYDYGPDAKLVKVTYPDGTSRSFRNGSDYQDVIDENGRWYSSHVYENRFAGARVLESRLAPAVNGGAIAHITYAYSTTPTGQRTVVTNALGRSATLDFVLAGGAWKVSSQSDGCASCGSDATTTYDVNGFVDLATDRNGVQRDYDYGADGLVRKLVEAVGTPQQRTIQADWDPTFGVMRERRTYNAAGALLSKTTWTLNARGQVLATTVTDPAAAISRTTTNTYCEQADVTAGTCPRVGLLTKVDGARTDVSDITTYTYRMADAPGCDTAPATCAYRKGDLWKVVNAKSQTAEILAYDGAGRILSVKDANGVVTDTEYDARGRITATKVRGADGAIETDDAITGMAYWPSGQVKQITQPDGTYIAFEYDDAHRLTAVTDAVGDRIEYTLDNAGNRTQEDTKDAAGNLRRTLSRVYNQLGQLQAVRDAYGSATTTTYDAAGNGDLTTDAKGRVTDSDFDPLNRLARTLQDTAGVRAQATFGYDALDNLTSVIDPKGLTTSYTYNGLGDLTKLVSPDTGTTSYTYDSAGNLKTKLDARGTSFKATYGYDVLNRLTSIVYATTSPNLNVTYAYDTVNSVCAAGEGFAIGRLTKMTDGSGNTQYCYDRFGRMVRKVQTTNGKVFTTAYQYAVSGRLLGMTYPSGLQVTYGYDAAGRPNTVKVTRPGQAQESLLSNVTYYPFGPVAELQYGNEDRVLTRQHDKNYRPSLIQDSTPAGLHYLLGWDEVGNLTGLSDTASNPNISVPLRSYGYDALNRLTAANDPNNVLLQGYSYDATGNRLTDTKVTGTGTTSYAYPTTSHRLTGVGGKARTYDAMGDTLTATVNGVAKTYTYDVTGRMNAAKNGSTVVMNYAYNGKGEQIRRYPTATSTAQTYEVYDEAGHWIGEYDSTGARKQEFIWLGDLPVGIHAASPGSTAVFQIYQVQPDHLGTPRAVIDAARRKAVWSWPMQGEAFGTTPPMQDPDADGKVFVLDMRFPGQRYDSASGLNYNYFRDYDTGSGRYVESDPLGLDGGITTYSYAAGSPTGYFDPYGLVVWTGKALPASAGAGLAIGAFVFDLTSQCVDGKRARVLVRAWGVGLGAGLKYLPPINATGGNVTIDDKLPFIDPWNFNGLFGTAGAGVNAANTGAGCTIYQIGNQWTPGVTRGACGTGGAGLDTSGSLMVGRSTLVGLKVSKCETCDKVDTPFEPGVLGPGPALPVR